MKWICTFCRRKALCGGITVIPPGNFNTSKKYESPNKDLVKLKDDWCITKYSNDDFIKLREVGDIFEYLASGSTPNTTFVTFDSVKGSRDKITTWSKEVNHILGKNVIQSTYIMTKKDQILYFACTKTYLIKNVIFKLQDIVSQKRNRLLNFKTCYYIMIWTIK